MQRRKSSWGEEGRVFNGGKDMKVCERGQNKKEHMVSMGEDAA
jgi:hypothetical protein